MTDTSAGSAAVDDLPPFASLTTDEDREKKAVQYSPGTYNVVLNQDSFQNLPEYTDDPDIKEELHSPLRRGSIAVSLASSVGHDTAIEGIPVPGDPNIVVLPKFEDIARRRTFSSSKGHRSPISPSMRQMMLKREETDEVSLTDMSASTSASESTNQDAHYLRQFRSVVWKHLVPAELDVRDGMMRSSVRVVESAANHFPPACSFNEIASTLG